MYENHMQDQSNLASLQQERRNSCTNAMPKKELSTRALKETKLKSLKKSQGILRMETQNFAIKLSGNNTADCVHEA